MHEGAFRADLFYRLNVFPITLPPLRDRVSDIPLLVWGFIQEFAEAMGRHVEQILPEDMHALQVYAWPGNVRELRNIIERGMIASTGSTLNVDVPDGSGAGSQGGTLEQVEKRYILEVLEATGWRVNGAGGAAEHLGLNPSTLRSRMARLGISRG
jgi:transcriptional regulator with GAF, ATPase, and Fis domain